MMSTQARQWIGYITLLALSAAAALTVFPVVHRSAVLLHRAELLTKEGRIAESDALIAQAVEAGARSPEAVLRAARIVLDDGRGAEAFALLGQTLDNMRNVPPGLTGRMAGLLDEYGMAVEALTLMLRADVGSMDRSERLHLADLLRRQGRFAEALEEYGTLVRDNPSDGEAALRHVETLAWKGDLETALPLARELVRSEPKNRAARLLLARVLYWSGHVDEAEAEYRRLLGETL